MARPKELWEEYRDLEQRAGLSNAGLHFGLRFLQEVLDLIGIAPLGGKGACHSSSGAPDRSRHHPPGVRTPASSCGANPRGEITLPPGADPGKWNGGGRRGMSAEIRPTVVASAESVVSEVVASQVSVRDLKTHLSEWLGRVQAGEEVEVTSHRKPIARITAVKPAAPAPASPLQRAINAGVISWNGQNPVIPPPVKLNDGGPLMSDIVIEDRG